jgi:4-amino-4-deoxy-L-arabinose transferase-like glycosyltransferase
MALLPLFALAVALRYWYVGLFGGFEDYLAWAERSYFGGCTKYYLYLKEQLLHGTYDSLGYPPGYPLFLAAAQWLGCGGTEALRLAQVVVDALAVFGVYALLRCLGIRPALAWWGSLFYAVLPPLGVGSTLLLAEALSPGLIVWTMLASLLAARSARPWVWLPAGALVGVAALIRPDLLLLIFPLALYAIWTSVGYGRAMAPACIALGAAPLLLAWGVHNYKTHGAWVLSSTSGGNTLYEGLGELPNPYGYVLDDAQTGEMLLEKGLTWHSVEANRYMKREFLRAVREHPGFVARVILNRWWNILREQEEWFSPLRPRLVFFKKLLRLRRDLTLTLVPFVVLVALWRRHWTIAWAVAMPLVYAMLSVGLVHYEPRYVRYAALSCVFAAIVAIDSLWQIVCRRWPRGRWAIAATLTTFVSAYLGYSTLVVHDTWLAAGRVAAVDQWMSQARSRARRTLDDLHWTTCVAGARLHDGPGELVIDTDKSICAYQALADVPVEKAECVSVDYQLDVEFGGGGVLVIDPQGRALASRTHAGPGSHRGRLTVLAPESEKFHIVVTNYAPGAAASSRIHVVRMDLHYFSPAASVMAGNSVLARRAPRKQLFEQLR